MNQQERAQRIVQDFIAVPRDRWLRTSYGGQGFFELEGHAGYALYFSKTLTDEGSHNPERGPALEQYNARLGTKLYALEVFDEDYECVCLLRWDTLDEIEVAEYSHCAWETVSFALPPFESSFSPTLH